MMFFGSLSGMNPLECELMKIKGKIRADTVNVKSNELLFYLFSIKTSKCSGSCNNINDSYAKLCVADVVKNLNIKVL